MAMERTELLFVQIMHKWIIQGDREPVQSDTGYGLVSSGTRNGEVATYSSSTFGRSSPGERIEEHRRGYRLTMESPSCLQIREHHWKAAKESLTYTSWIRRCAHHIAVVIWRTAIRHLSNHIEHLHEQIVPLFRLYQAPSQRRSYGDIWYWLTLHDANILCSVIHIAPTVSTGDHSFANMEAQIYVKAHERQ